MAFFIPTVERCPIASSSVGRVEIKQEILGMFAGAVQDPDEWLVLLLGEVRMGGLHVIVDEIYVPAKQERSRAHCSTKEDLPPEVTSRLVGVLHSHNNQFSAEFSPTDRGEDGLNSIFPLSIVISSQYGENDREFCLLGFAYEAEGRFTLPCGSLGIARFTIHPKGLTDWPFRIEPSIPATNGTVNDVHDCSSWEESKDSTLYDLRKIAVCGIEESETHTRKSAFGSDGERILSQLPTAYDPPRVRRKGRLAALIPDGVGDIEGDGILDWGLFEENDRPGGDEFVELN